MKVCCNSEFYQPSIYTPNVSVKKTPANDHTCCRWEEHPEDGGERLAGAVVGQRVVLQQLRRVADEAVV